MCEDCGSFDIPTGPDGTDGKQGLYGGYSTDYTYSTGSVSNGTFKVTNVGSIYTITVSPLNYDGTDCSAMFLSIQPSFLRIFKIDDSNQFQLFKLTSVSLVAGNYAMVGTLISSNGTFLNTDHSVLTFTPYFGTMGGFQAIFRPSAHETDGLGDVIVFPKSSHLDTGSNTHNIGGDGSTGTWDITYNSVQDATGLYVPMFDATTGFMTIPADGKYLFTCEVILNINAIDTTKTPPITYWWAIGLHDYTATDQAAGQVQTMVEEMNTVRINCSTSILQNTAGTRYSWRILNHTFDDYMSGILHNSGNGIIISAIRYE